MKKITIFLRVSYLPSEREMFFQAEVVWVMTPCSVVVGYQYDEDGGSMDLWNVGILPQHYTASQLRKLRLETSLLWKPQNSYQEPKTFLS